MGHGEKELSARYDPGVVIISNLIFNLGIVLLINKYTGSTRLMLKIEACHSDRSSAGTGLDYLDGSGNMTIVAGVVTYALNEMRTVMVK